MKSINSFRLNYPLPVLAPSSDGPISIWRVLSRTTFSPAELLASKRTAWEIFISKMFSLSLSIYFRLIGGFHCCFLSSSCHDQDNRLKQLCIWCWSNLKNNKPRGDDVCFDLKFKIVNAAYPPVYTGILMPKKCLLNILEYHKIIYLCC